MKSYEELIRMAAENNEDIKHCSICGVPFYPRHSRQKTCASEECKKLHHRNYTKQYLEEQGEIAKEKHREANRRWSKNRYRKNNPTISVAEQIEHDNRQKAFDEKIKEYGDHYGEVQKQKILQSVERIKTEL